MARFNKKRLHEKTHGKAENLQTLRKQDQFIDFKDADLLKKFQTEKGRILPRRITGTCLRHQKMLSVAVKRARIISIVL